MKRFEKYLIWGLVVLTVGAIGTAVYFAIRDKDCDCGKNSESEEFCSNNELDKLLKSSIKENDIYNFLDPLVGNGYNLLIEYNKIIESDDDIFAKVIILMVAQDMYEKSGDNFIFKSGELKKLAHKYYNKSDFEYFSESHGSAYNSFTYDSIQEEYISKLDFGLFSEGPDETITKKINGYKIENGNIIVDYTLDYKFDENPSLNSTYNYKIILLHNDDSYFIKTVN